jgi:type III pantothenate kinase
MKNADYLLVDISNSFTKVAPAKVKRMGAVRRIPTRDLCAGTIHDLLDEWGARKAVVASVVPSARTRIEPALPGGSLFVGPTVCADLAIDYPEPSKIGPDRLANAIGCLARFAPPCIVVDFGTAVTFDVISEKGAYIGGVIAPGLGLMSEYLHSRTALLPHIHLQAPPRAVGRSTREAMLSGAVHGYRGLVKEILDRIREEEFPRLTATVVATGGDASLIGGSLPLFDHIIPKLTLQGLLLIARHHLPT